jgi:hypothetical protein
VFRSTCKFSRVRWVWSRFWSFQVADAPAAASGNASYKLTSQHRAIVDELMCSHEPDAAAGLLVPVPHEGARADRVLVELGPLLASELVRNDRVRKEVDVGDERRPLVLEVMATVSGRAPARS